MNTLFIDIKSKIEYQWRPLSEFKLAKEPLFFNIVESQKFKHTLLAYNRGRVSELIDPKASFYNSEIV